MSEVVMYTDGGCAPNPGVGGWGAIMMHGIHIREFSKGYAKTTNNRMELLAVIENLERLKRPCKVEVYSDSEYVCNSMNMWIHGWARRGWKTSSGKTCENVDLMKRMFDQMKIHKTEAFWVKGHDGNEHNERCDELATIARDNAINVDLGYVKK